MDSISYATSSHTSGDTELDPLSPEDMALVMSSLLPALKRCSNTVIMSRAVKYAKSITNFMLRTRLLGQFLGVDAEEVKP